MDEILERIVACIGPRHGAKKQLAEHLGIHPNVITNWLSGRNKSYLRYLDQIADFYGVSVKYLRTGETEKPAAPKDDELYQDDLIAFYGEVKDVLDEQDIEDVKNYLRIKAEIKKNRLEKK